MYTESLRAFLKPVLSYLDDEAVSEILINGPEDIWIERKGRLFKTDARFSEEGLIGAARNVAQFVGRPLSEERPRLDARLPDGSRIHVVIPPIARQGTTISIRKFFKDRMAMKNLIELGTLSQEMSRLIEAAINIKLNIMVSGGTGSGKTTLLNVISELIPEEERILTIEDSAELQLEKKHLVCFESRPPDKYGKGGVDMGDLLQSALRLRPDRIIVGEVRGGECFHLMQALNTGHGGSLSTCHANTPMDTLRRLESLYLMSTVEMPLVAVRAQVASAIHLILCCERLYDGSRKITHVSEVLPLNERGEYRTQDLWVFTPVGRDPEGNIYGYYGPTGIIPSWVGRARAYGYPEMDEHYFDPFTYDLPPPPIFNVGEEYSVRWAPSLKHREKGQPDPDDFKAQWTAFERKLRDETRATAAAHASAAPAPAPTPAPAPAAAKPKLAAAHAAPPRSPPPPARKPPDDDKTPPPTRMPQRSVAESAPHTDPTAVAARPSTGEAEPLVEISEDLLQEASRLDITQPPRRYPPPPPQRSAKPAPAPAPSRKPSEPAQAVEDPDKTTIKPVPERPRR